MKFTAQPSATPVSATITPGVMVQAIDSLGRGVPGVAVTISIGANAPAIGHSDWPGTGTLHGTLTRNTDATGVATFNDLKLDFVGDAYTLVATVSAASGELHAVSASFPEQRVNACLGPAAPACASGCPDSDGDGLNDAWKQAGGIDFNGDGIVSAEEKVLTNFDSLRPDGTPNPHPSAEMGRKDVFVRYDSMQVAGSGAACITDSDCGGHCSDTWVACTSNASCTAPATCVSDQYCVGQCSVHTGIACNTVFDCGGFCSATAAQFCQLDADCPAGETCIASGEQCVNTTCHGHDDGPTPAALMQVVQAYDAHGISLHFSPEHRVVPHAHVTSYGPPIDGCATPRGHVNDPGRAVDFYSLKPAEAVGGGMQRPFIHYALFGHLETCDSPADCNSGCPPNPDSGALPLFRAGGLAEIVGNDMILAYGANSDGTNGKTEPGEVKMAGTFMHELGHNLGLDHGGPYFVNDHALNFKPNYLSVMNYSFQDVGISNAAEAGSIVPVGTRVDYSDAALAPLDEENLNETIGINAGTNDITTYFCPGTTRAPATGPIDWDCDGDGGTETRSGAAAGLPHVEIDNNSTGDTFLGGYADWPNLNFAFQCDANGHYGAGAAAGGITSQELDDATAASRHVEHPAKAVSISVGAACSSIAPPAADLPSAGFNVVILGALNLDVSQVKFATLKFAHATPLRASIADVNGDGLPDLLLEFRAEDLKNVATTGQIPVTGLLLNGAPIAGQVDAGAVRDAASAALACKAGGKP